MTSMFDQYNKTLKREEHPPDISSYNEPKSSGYVSVRIRSEEQPIFSKQKMKLNLPNDILFMNVCNDWLVTLMAHQVILRLFLRQPDRQDGKVQFIELLLPQLIFIQSPQRYIWKNIWLAWKCRICFWTRWEIIYSFRWCQSLRDFRRNCSTCIEKRINRKKSKNSKITKWLPSHSTMTTNRIQRPVRYWLAPAEVWYLRQSLVGMGIRCRIIGNRWATGFFLVSLIFAFRTYCVVILGAIQSECHWIMCKNWLWSMSHFFRCFVWLILHVRNVSSSIMIELLKRSMDDSVKQRLL